MEFDIFHLPGVKNQDADAVYRLIAAGEHFNPVDDALPVMSFNTLPEDGRKGRIKPSNVID